MEQPFFKLDFWSFLGVFQAFFLSFFFFFEIEYYLVSLGFTGFYRTSLGLTDRVLLRFLSFF